MQKVTKAVIPAAGFGTRFLPATKAQPKEMLPIVDKPIIQYVVEEAVAAGITDIIIITGSSKRSIEDHFDSSFELEARLKEQRKSGFLKEMQRISKLANFVYVRQREQLGDGHAIMQAYSLLRDEPFAVLFGDTIMDGRKRCLKEMVKLYEEFQSPVVAVSEVPRRDVSSYGVIGGVKIREHVHQMTEFVEKPASADAPSRLAGVGYYIASAGLLETLKRTPRRRGNELRLADSLKRYLVEHPAYAYTYPGTWYDCGDKLGYLKATIEFGLRHQELKQPFRRYLKNL